MVSDSEYDELFDELKKLESETGIIMANSPTQSVGYEAKSKLEKVSHSIPLKSLDKTKSIDELYNFIGDEDCLLMLKADGLTVELIYENGKLIQGSTRGNGEIGEDITHNVKTFKNVPLTIPYQGRLKIVGEAIIHKNDFEIINSKLSEEEKYATPRNLVSGSVRQLDSKICANRSVYFYAFGLLECDDFISESKVEIFNFINKNGFWTIINANITKETNIHNVIELMRELGKEYFIPIDGLVFTYNSVSYSNSLGSTSHHPLHSLAFKFLDEAETTILREIEWSVGRTGTITPVAIFDPVIIDNTEVTRASVHNISIIEDLELGLLDSISIVKANQIIPQIEENFTRSNTLVIPDSCPACGGDAMIKQLNDSKVLECVNNNCSAKLLKKLSHFVSRDAMNIEGLSEATLEKFIEMGIVKSFVDIYKLYNYPLISDIQGFGKKSYQKLVDAVDKSKNVDMANFIYALGINGIGKGGAKRLAKHYRNNFDNLIDDSFDYINYMHVEDFGEVTAIALAEYLKNKENLNQLSELFQHITIKKSEKTNNISNSVFSGKKVYATGTFANYKKDELKLLLESLGAEFASGYAKSLDYLIVGGVKGSSKEDKAKKDGVPILTEDEFIKIISG